MSKVKPLNAEEWHELEQMVLIARAMDESWESTYVQVPALLLLRVMKMAGWVAPPPKPRAESNPGSGE